jgi:hypothetical protein
MLLDIQLNFHTGSTKYPDFQIFVLHLLNTMNLKCENRKCKQRIGVSVELYSQLVAQVVHVGSGHDWHKP